MEMQAAGERGFVTGWKTGPGVEKMIENLSDEELPAWNAVLQTILDEQVRRDLEYQDQQRNLP